MTPLVSLMVQAALKWKHACMQAQQASVVCYTKLENLHNSSIIKFSVILRYWVDARLRSSGESVIAIFMYRIQANECKIINNFPGLGMYQTPGLAAACLHKHFLFSKVEMMKI